MQEEWKVWVQERTTWEPWARSERQMAQEPAASPLVKAVSSTSDHSVSVSFPGEGGARPRSWARVGGRVRGMEPELLEEE